MTVPVPNPRIAVKQALAAKAKQVLMTGDLELGLFVYRQPYQLGNAEQRASLAATLEEEFHASIPLPEIEMKWDATAKAHVPKKSTVYLVVVAGTPVLVHENDALAFTLGLALAKGGIDMARRVSYRLDMLPLPRT